MIALLHSPVGDGANRPPVGVQLFERPHRPNYGWGCSQKKPDRPSAGQLTKGAFAYVYRKAH
jgi:hypothetical protein